MALTDEEKRRIEEEEAFRAEARLRAEPAIRKKLEKEAREKKAREGCIGCLGMIVFFVVVGALLPKSSEVPASSPSTSLAPGTDKTKIPLPGTATPKGKTPPASPASKASNATKKPSPSAAAKTPKAEVRDSECMKDLQCWAERHFSAASVRCPGEIEKLAKFSAKWTDGWLEPKLRRYRWRDASRGVVTYIGDRVQFQNGFGAWQDHTYECDLKCEPDSTNDTVLAVRAAPGRMN